MSTFEKIVILNTALACRLACHPTINSIEIVLSDFRYWGPILHQLDVWCLEHHCRRTGSVLFLPDEETFLLFKLTWL